MNRYKRRVIGFSIFIHMVALVAVFFYWLLKEPPEEESNQARLFDKAASSTAEAQAAEGGKKAADEKTETQQEEPPVDRKEDEEFLNDQLLQEIAAANEMTLKEKNKVLNENLGKISKIDIKEVEKMADAIEKMAGAEGAKRSSNANHELKMGEVVDVTSLRLYDYEIVDEKYVLKWRDKNNIIIKGSPQARSEIDSDTWLRMKLAKKARQSKKFEMLLNAVENIADKMMPQDN